MQVSAVAKIRSQLGLTQNALAKALRVSRAAIWNYEAEIRHPSKKVAYKLIDFALANGIRISLEDVYPR